MKIVELNEKIFVTKINRKKPQQNSNEVTSVAKEIECKEIRDALYSNIMKIKTHTHSGKRMKKKMNMRLESIVVIEY